MSPQLAHRDMALLQRNGSDFQQRTFMSGEAVDLQCRLLGCCVDVVDRLEAEKAITSVANMMRSLPG